MFDYRTMFDLHNRNALVVGGGSGIGQASALALAAHGASVICADVNAKGAEATAQDIRAQGGQASTAAVDMRDSAQINALIADLDQRSPKACELRATQGTARGTAGA